MTDHSPTPNQAWHELFATAPLSVLSNALDAGIVPLPCLDDQGRDLLFTVLNRPLETGYGMRAHADRLNNENAYAPSLRQVREGRYASNSHQAAVAVFLLKLAQRSDVQPWALQPSTYPDLKGKWVTAVDLALAWQIPSLVQHCFDLPEAPKGEALREWNEDVSSQPSAPGHRTRLALAVHRYQGIVIDTLLSKGLDINALDKEGATVLFSADAPSVVKFLFDRGADPRVMGGGRTLFEHWGAKLPSSTYQGLVSLVMERTPLSPEHAATAALNWLAAHPFSLGSYDRGEEKKVAEWEQAWQGVSSKVDGSLPMSQWRRQIPSGIWKGKASLLAEASVPFLEIEMQNNASVPASLALLPPPQEWFGKEPVVFRRGVTDWGLFAMGAYRFLNSDLASKERKSSRKKGTLATTHEQLLQRTEQRILEVFALLPQARWDSEWISASAALMKSSRSEIQKAVVASWVERFEYEDNRDKGRGMPLDKQIELAARGLEAGVRLGGEIGLEHLLGWAATAPNAPWCWSHGPTVAHLLLETVGRAQWARDHGAKNQDLSPALLQKGWNNLASLVLAVFVSPEERNGWWERCATPDTKAAALKAWDGTPLGRELSLEEALPKVTAKGPKTRF